MKVNCPRCGLNMVEAAFAVETPGVIGITIQCHSRKESTTITYRDLANAGMKIEDVVKLFTLRSFAPPMPTSTRESNLSRDIREESKLQTVGLSRPKRKIDLEE